MNPVVRVDAPAEVPLKTFVSFLGCPSNVERSDIPSEIR